MEIQGSLNLTILVLIISSITLLLMIKAWRKAKLTKNEENFPPSPPKLPIIGHLHHLISRWPHHALTRVTQQYGSVLHLKLGEVSAVVISSRDAAKEALKAQDPACADRPDSISMKILWYDYNDIAFSPYNECWRQMRKICILEMLSAKNVKSFGSMRVDEVSRLVRILESSCGEPVNLTNKVFALTSSIASRAAFGKVMKEPDVMMSLIREGLALAGGFELADLFPSSFLANSLSWNKYKLLRMRRRLDSILDSMIAEHKKRQSGEFGGEDIIDVLLRVQSSGELQFPITNDNIKGVIFLDLLRELVTNNPVIHTGHVCRWYRNIIRNCRLGHGLMAELMKNPRVMSKLQAEIRKAAEGKATLEEIDVQGVKYLKLVIKETLRLHPPIPLIARACRDKCTVNGYTIPLKSKVIVNVWSMGRNPDFWDNPETFQPERFEDVSRDFLGNSFEFIPFGAGKRMCPGMNFGLANVELPLARLLYHFDWHLPNGASPSDMDMTEGDGVTVSRKQDLFLVPTAYNNVSTKNA